MKKIATLLFALLTILCLQSCVKDADVKLPPVETKLVLSSFISPQDSLVQVSVSLSVPLYNNPDAYQAYKPVTNATVIISSGSDSWSLPYNSQYHRYVLDSARIKIKAGASYSLSVSTPEGKFAEASTTVPYLNNTLTFTTTINTTNPNTYQLFSTWQDPPNSKDYYQIEQRVKHPTIDNHYRTFDNLSDEENPGGVLKRKLTFTYNAPQGDTILLTLSTTAPEEYLYYERLKRTGPDDPFTEPVPLYTNIKGGFGIFTGFNQYVVRVFPY